MKNQNKVINQSIPAGFNWPCQSYEKTKAAEMPKSCRPQLWAWYGRGFTLIELLVVVLIIGILAAVAIPQYERSVERARISEIWSTLATMDQAIKVAKLENPTGPLSLSSLSVSFPGDTSPHSTTSFSSSAGVLYNLNYDHSTAQYHTKSGAWLYLYIEDGKKHCASDQTDGCKKYVGLTVSCEQVISTGACFTE